MLDDDSGDHDNVVFIRKQTSKNFGDFIQSSNLFRRHMENAEGERSSTNNSRNEAQQGSHTENNEEVGHLDGWIEDVMEAISDPFLIKKEATAIADLCKKLNRPRLVINKGQIKEHYGYEVDGTTYLWAEEALYLIETGKLELYVDEIATSVERARALLLHSTNIDAGADEDADILSCENDEYTVYKYFAKLGYRIRRREALRYSKRLEGDNANPNVITVDAYEDSDDPIDEDELLSCTTDSSLMGESQFIGPQVATSSTQIHFQACEVHSFRNRGTKRKAGLGLISEDEEGSADGDNESESVRSFSDDAANEGYSLVSDEMMEETDTVITESQYSVVEADDSDVEFVDEFIFSHSLVEIKELEANDPIIDDLENLPGPSNAQQQRGPSPVILDLVSSSESDCEEITNESIWSNFLSVNTFEMKFPASHLLPDNIPARSDNRVYKYHKNQGENTAKVNEGAEEMDIEKTVDDFQLDASRNMERKNGSKGNDGMRETERVKCDSWKEWRHLIMTEARDALNESLLGSRITTTNDVTKKLNLWPTRKNHATGAGAEAKLRIPFDLFPIVNRSVSKHQLWTKILPLYHVAVVRTTDPVVSSYEMDAHLKAFNDNVPLLIALVDNDSDVLVLSSDLKPLPSLY